MKFTKRLLASAVAVSLVTPITAMATNGYFSHGYGTANKGLAGGGSALPQDAMIAATNPAGMAFVGGRLDVGLALFSPRRKYTAGPSTAGCAAPGNCTFTIGGSSGNQSIDSDNELFMIPHFAYNRQITADSTLGVSVYGNGGMNTEYKGGQAAHESGPGTGTIATTPGTFGGGTAGVNLEQLFIAVTYAHKYSATGAVGFTPIYAYQRFEAKGLGLFAPYSTDPNHLSDKGADTSTGFGAKLGWMDEVSPGLTLAASYQSKMKMSEFSDYKGLYAEGGDFDIPATWTVGLAFKLASTSTVTFDMQKILYSGVKSIADPMSPIFPPASGGQCTAGATGGTGAGCLGGPNGAGFGWQDITVYKLGYQWSTSADWTWRAGYSYGDQPIRDSEVLFNILAPAVQQHHFTFGFTTKTGASSELSVAAMYSPESKVTGQNAFDPNQTIEIKMHQYELEANWGWKF